MRRLAALLPLLVAGAGPAPAARCATELVYFASMTSPPGKGVFGARFDSCAGKLQPLGLAAEIDKPTWVTAHPSKPVLYATSEIADPAGPAIRAYRVDRATGRLDLINHTVSGGAGATYLAVDAASRTLFAAHWISGHVSALPIRADGGLEPPVSVQRDEGSGPRPFQTGPRSHATVLDPTRRYLLVPDIGADRLFVYRFNPRTRLLSRAVPAFEPLPAGAGPRHLLFHSNGRFAYLINQLTSDIRVYRWTAATGRLRLEQVQSTIASTYEGKNDAAEIGMSADGRYLYASNRGEDTLVAYAVDPRNGRLAEIQRLPSGGKLPRAFAIDKSGRWMLVANQDSNAVTAFARDPATGRLRATPETIAVPQPAGFAFIAPKR